MAQRTIDHFYPSYAEAVQVVADLSAAGVTPASISLIESETDARLPKGIATAPVQNPAATGATVGAGIGGCIGALDGVGAINIPYTESLVATGWLVPCLVFAAIGAVIGVVVGAIAGLGLRNTLNFSIASRLQRGEHLVMVQPGALDVSQVESIMARSHTIPAAALATSEPIWDDNAGGVAQTNEDEVEAPIHATTAGRRRPVGSRPVR